MIIIIAFFIISLAIGIASACQNNRSYHDNSYDGFLVGFLVPIICSALICIIIWSVSYDNYVDMLKVPALIEQKVTAINAYRQVGIKSFNEANSSLTDTKFSNYQTEMANMINDLRKLVETYNKLYVGKTAYKANALYSWFIFSPPKNSKPLLLINYLN